MLIKTAKRRTSRHRFTQHECALRGRIRAMQANFPTICHMGWEATYHKYGMQNALAIVHKRSGKRKKTQ